MADAILTDGARVPIHTIFCIGRNYAAHAKELDNPVPQAPVVFIKPDTTLVQSGGEVLLPQASQNVQHEVEMVVLLGSGGKHINERDALSHVAGYGVGIDVTARDIQNEAKKFAYPWTVGKGFDSFAPISEFVPAERITDPQGLQLSLTVNGNPRQQGNTDSMLFGVARLIAHLSGIFTLQCGDLIFTGTPPGVRRFEAGERLDARLSDASGKPLAELHVTASQERPREE